MKRLQLWAALAAALAIPTQLPAQVENSPAEGGVPRTQFEQNIDGIRQSVQNAQQGLQGRHDRFGLEVVLQQFRYQTFVQDQVHR